MTGVDPEYFTTSGSGTRASASFSSPTGSAISLTASDILTGMVSGVSGQSLSGTYSANFTTSNGYSGTFSGPITINPNGTFSYSYTNLSGSNGTYTVTGAGSTSGTPGTYFTQTAVGSLAMAGNTAGNQQTLTNLNGYSIWGTRTGVYPGTFAANLNMTSTAPVNRLLSSRRPGQYGRQHAGCRQRHARRAANRGDDPRRLRPGSGWRHTLDLDLGRASDHQPQRQPLRQLLRHQYR